VNIGTKSLEPDDTVQKQRTHCSDENAVYGEKNSQAIPSHETLKEVFRNKCFVSHFAVKLLQLSILV
jgi:hypothetical protein